jgi:CysZ protein
MLLTSLALTIALLVLAWLVLTRLFATYLEAHTISGAYPILDTIAFFLAGFGLVIGLAYLVPAVTALVAGYFLDDAAAVVEREHYPGEPPGQALTVGRALLYGARFAALSLMVNIVALLLVFIPGVNLVAFFAANGYLLGREYFELAAGRFRPMPEAAALRQRHRGTVFLAGLLIAALVIVPILNLLTPLFGIALMVHVYQGVKGQESGIGNQKQLTTRS